MRKALVAMVALAACLLWAGSVLADPPAAGTDAPDFKLTDLDGKEVALKDLKGKVVFVDFWATWCPPCKRALPHTQEISEREEVKKGDLVVLAVSNETEEVVKKFLEDNKYTFRTACDKGLGSKYGVRGIPTFVTIGKDGKVVESIVGFGGDDTAKQIDEAIAKALKADAPK